MTTQEFFNTLKEHPGKSLLFQYTPGQLVGANYHITEVKHITVDSVDCGAREDSWKETIIQLWEKLGRIPIQALFVLNIVMRCFIPHNYLYRQ